MAAMSFRRALTDRLTLVQVIRRIFSCSPIFRDATISDPYFGPEGEAIVDVSFDQRTTALRVIAPSVEEAYAILHELASAMVEVESGRHGQSDRQDDEFEAVSVDLTE